MEGGEHQVGLCQLGFHVTAKQQGCKGVSRGHITASQKGRQRHKEADLQQEDGCALIECEPGLQQPSCHS